MWLENGVKVIGSLTLTFETQEARTPLSPIPLSLPFSTTEFAMPHAHSAAVVDRLLRRLASDARRLDLPANADEDVAHVGGTLARLQDVLVSLETKYFKMPAQVQEWIGNIKQIAYDMEDLLDEFEDPNSMTSQNSGWAAKETPFCCSCPCLLHSTGINRLKAIKRRLGVSAKDSVIFSLMQHPCPDLEQFDNGTFDGATIVGRDNDKAMLKDMFLQTNAEKLSVIPIVGLVGLGKTSLARLIFYDQGEGWKFDIRIWIYLNRKLDLREIASDIISQCSQAEENFSVYRNCEMPENLQLLKNRLRDVLLEKRCLIVLDGLSSTDKMEMEELKEMLAGTNGSTKVLVTTSNEITAELVHTAGPYKLNPLSEDDCWEIFSQKAFWNVDTTDAHLKEIGRQIVKRCEGIPLLAHSLGSLVQSQVKNVWLAARDEELWKLERRHITRMEMFSPFYQIYYALPSAVKLCFLYLSIFPKGSVIDKEKLIRQWIALDMIGSKYHSLPSYVHGEICIQDLLSTYLLQVLRKPSVEGIDNRIAPTVLYMHNFAHEFASHVACDDAIIFNGSEIQTGIAKRQTFQYALLTYYRGQLALPHSLLTRTRALHLRNMEATVFDNESFEFLKHLRVLNLSGCCIGELPVSVAHLKHLRYLDVSGLQIQILPYQMSRLTNLETLDLSKTSLRELPSFIDNFPKLKYLNMEGCENLQTLPSALGHLQRLEHLSLSSCNNICELPDSMCNINDLRFLDLSRCTELQLLPPLFGNLMNLEDLSLSSCFSLKKLPESFGNLYFLRYLNLSSCYKLQHLPESLTNLEKLEVLILRRCCRLRSLPPSLASIKYLQVLDLAGCEALHVSTEILTTNLEYLNLQECIEVQNQPYCFENFNKLKFLNLSHCLPTTDCLNSVGYLFNLEYLDLSENFLDIPMSFTRLQKLHTLDLSGCPPMHLSSRVHKTLLDIICKMTALRFVLTKDPVLMASLPRHVRCSVGIDERCHVTSDELDITDMTGGSRGLNIAENLNLQNRLDLRFLKLEWIHSSRSDIDELIDDVNEDEVLERLRPNQSLEHFKLVEYAGCTFPTWMTNTMITSLPYLASLWLFHLENCTNLPPLGQLRNLRYLHINDMPNLRYLDMGLSGSAEPFRKLTHLKLEMLNLKELHILLPANNENQQFMFPVLEELSVLSCSELIFKPSLPKCAKYEIKESNMILSCGQPLGPLSSPSPQKIVISGCRIPSAWLYWLKSLQTLEKVVIDGEPLTSVKLPDVRGVQESSSSLTSKKDQSSYGINISHELTTQDDTPKNTGIEGSTIGTLEKVVIDGEPLTSFKLPEVRGVQESSSSLTPNKDQSSYGINISHGLTSQGGTPKNTGNESSTIGKPLSSFNTTSGHSVDPASSSKMSTPFKEIPSSSSTLYKPKMSAEIPRVGPLNLSLKQIQKATRNFSPLFKLGEGEIWTVYKAVLPENQIVIIRRAKKGHVQEAKLLMKGNLLTEINHCCLVRFLGFVDKGNECIRITEYVPNGTLRQHLYGQHKRILDFNQRIVIALDVAIALAYLHLSCGEELICYNLKTSNILLTESYRAKLCCSGLSGSGHVVPLGGTVGYIDPEYFRTSELTAKSDIYSFGIVLLEILSSHGPQDWNLLMNHQNSSVVQWALEKFYDDLVNEILDYRLEDRVDGKVLRDWLSLALSCVASSGDDRPSIEVVGERLWKIWKDHRLCIGAQFEYEGSWAEFVEKEGFLSHHKSTVKRKLDIGMPMGRRSFTTMDDGWSGYIRQIEMTQEAYIAHEAKSYLGSRSGSFDDITVLPR
ncbi:hypothetical protein EJB05_53700, partial [Eragrostis curvula]